MAPTAIWSGEHDLAVIDPGPENDDHYDALFRAIGDRPVSHIFVSHTHRDHSPLAARLSKATGALVCAEGPHRPARNPPTGTAARQRRGYLLYARYGPGATVICPATAGRCVRC